MHRPVKIVISLQVTLMLLLLTFAANVAFSTSTKRSMLPKTLLQKVSQIPLTSKVMFVPLRGGYNDVTNSVHTSNLGVQKLWLSIVKNPENIFNSVTLILVFASLLGKLYSLHSINSSRMNIEDSSIIRGKPKGVLSLQRRFLLVFWLLRMADWLQGPYFYEVYSSKFINGVPLSLDMISKLFLIGFATTGICGPWMGGIVDNIGRRGGTLLYTLLYTVGALSTRSSSLWNLAFGRLAGGLGTSLLFSAPEAWLIAEHQRQSFDASWLAQTFSWAFAGDSIVAIVAGQLASWAVKHVDGGGPSGPFTLSVLFLLAAAVLIVPLWTENIAQKHNNIDSKPNMNRLKDDHKRVSTVFGDNIEEALKYLLGDRRLLLLGAVQALFEGAMYIFVLQWPPAVRAVFSSAQNVPYGNIFSSFMASCFLGSTVFNILQSSMRKREKKNLERDTAIMLSVASVSMALAAGLGLAGRHLGWLMTSFLLFEACVGMYFPSIGMLRSKYVPDAYRSVIMNCFGVPLNLIVVLVFVNIKRLGSLGALSIASGALIVAAACMMKLASLATTSE